MNEGYNNHVGRVVLIRFERGVFLKKILRSAASVVLGFVLWFILYIALVLLCALVIYKVPKLASIVDWFVSILHAQHWYAILILGIPAIIPGIIMELIMKSATNTNRKWTTYILLGVIAIAILTINGYTFFGKVEGILGAYLGLVLGKSVINND